MVEHCCDMMKEQVEYTCEQHPDRFDCPDCLVHYSARRQGYGLIIHDGGRSMIQIQYCPWCGSELPSGERSALPDGDSP